MKKKIIALALAATVALSLVACNSSTSESTESKSESTESGSTESESAGTESESVTTETNDAAEKQGGSTEGDTESETGYEITYQSFQLHESNNGVSTYAIVEVENTGTTNLKLKSPTFTFLNEDGSLAGVVSGIISKDPEILLPGEKGYYYTNSSSVDGDIDVNGNYTFIPEISAEETTNEPVNYDLSDLSISEGSYGKSEVMGRITNPTDEDTSIIWVAVILFDKDGNPLAGYGTNVNDIPAGETKTFDCTASHLVNMDLSYDEIADYKVFAQK